MHTFTLPLPLLYLYGMLVLCSLLDEVLVLWKKSLKEREENDLVWLFGCNCNMLDPISVLWKSPSVSNQAS